MGNDVAEILYGGPVQAEPDASATVPMEGAEAVYAREPEPALAVPARPFDAADFNAALDPLIMDAIKDGNEEKADEIEASRKGLLADFEAAGTSASVAGEVAGIINSYAYSAPNEAMRAEQHERGLEVLGAEWGQDRERNIGLAARLIGDLEQSAPGLIDTLNSTGAGNDPKLVMRAYEEARRRGYA